MPQRGGGTGFLGGGIPGRHHIGIADRRIDGLLEGAELDGIEGVDATGSPGRATPCPGVALADAIENCLAGNGNDQVRVELALDGGDGEAPLNGLQQRIGCKTLRSGTIREKAQIALRVEAIGGAAYDDVRRLLERELVALHMAY